ncbi:cell wall metabolism sensor histidine kinase WalK [Leptotrichia sp. OH3620_COT-345]|uniref:sensor histidine kinase n=1 Tax=Leptotrichia sp. OH3620_COT-345 TaxID=2491048 RepID=UPI0018F736A5|nr:HAMP domain-containing sensor histidine kinase [Leptotrichia sp. OH3620_COT-345]
MNKLRKLFTEKLSIKMRITFWYTSLIIGITALFLGTMVYIGGFVIRNSVYRRLKNTVENTFKRIEFHNNELILDNNLDTSVTDIFVSIYDKNKEFIYGDSHLDFEFSDSFSENNKIKTVTQGYSRWYVYEIQKKLGNYGNIWIRGITPASVAERNMEVIILIFLVIFPFLVLISAIGGYFITEKAFRPIENITKTAEKISEGNDLSRRIDIGDRKDEISILANTFDKMFDRLQNSFDREVQFTSDVSHELRTPISIISSQSEYGIKYLKINKETEEIFESILDESKKMSNLISKLLMLARMEKGNRKLNIENTNLSEMAEIAIETQRTNAEKKNISLNRVINEEIYVDIDESMIMRVLINLISNAIFYGKKNGNVLIEIFTNNGKVICKVSDDGIGISEEHIDKIWDRFYQVDPSRAGDNSGLGLSMVKWIVEAHNGKIDVESEINKGSIFSFELPLNKKIEDSV